MNENKRTGIPFYILSIVILALVFGLGFYLNNKPVEPNLSGVNITHEYTATTTALMTGTLVKAAQTDHLIASSTAGITLGSVIVSTTTANWLTIYNATSSAAVTDGTYATEITTLMSSLSLGAYPYDIWLDEGLVIRMEAGFAGSYTITYRR